jgi:hypothetical protein
MIKVVVELWKLSYYGITINVPLILIKVPKVFFPRAKHRMGRLEK